MSTKHPPSDGEGSRSPGYVPWRRGWARNPLLDDESQAAQRRLLLLSPEVKTAEVVEDAEDMRDGLATELCDELDKMFSDEPVSSSFAPAEAKAPSAPAASSSVVVIGSTSESMKDSPLIDGGKPNTEYKAVGSAASSPDYCAEQWPKAATGATPACSAATVDEKYTAKPQIQATPQGWLETLKERTVPMLMACFEEYRNVRLVLQQIILGYSISRLQVPLPAIQGLSSPSITDEEYLAAKETLSLLDSAFYGAQQPPTLNPTRREPSAASRFGPYRVPSPSPASHAAKASAVFERRPPSPGVAYVLGPGGTILQPEAVNTGVSAPAAKPLAEPILVVDDQMTDSTASTAGVNDTAPVAASAAAAAATPAPVVSPTQPTTTPAKKAAAAKTPASAGRVTRSQTATKAKTAPPPAEQKSARAKRQRATPPAPAVKAPAGGSAATTTAVTAATRKKRRSRQKADEPSPPVKAGDVKASDTPRKQTAVASSEAVGDSRSPVKIEGSSPNVTISPPERLTPMTRGRSNNNEPVATGSARSGAKAVAEDIASSPEVREVPNPLLSGSGTAQERAADAAAESTCKTSFCKVHGEFKRGSECSGCPECATQERTTAAANGFVLLKTHSSVMGKTFELKCNRGHIGIYARLVSACEHCARIEADRKQRVERERQQQRQQQKLFEEAKWRLPHGFKAGTKMTAPAAPKMSSVVGEYPQADPTGSLTIERLVACHALRLVGWEVLGVARPRTATQVKAALNTAKLVYKKLVMRVHPDKCQHPQSKEAFHILDAAWKAVQRYQ